MRAPTQTSSELPVDAPTLERYADLIVGLGASVQPGQIVEIRAMLEQRDLVRAIAASAYRAGARFVDAVYHDPYVRRSRILHAAPDTLEFVPTWHRDRVRALGEHSCARVSLSPANPPELFEDLEPATTAREPFPFIPEYLQILADNTTNWTGVACPTQGWATSVHPDLEPAEALAKLWEEILHVCRLDEPDPEIAWRRRFAELERVARTLSERRFDSLRFEGPGTSLTVGLFPSSEWKSGTSTTAGGIVHAPNLPTEETFTAPDPDRVEGVVKSTKPLVLKGGVLVDGLVVRFERGRAVRVDADRGGEAMRSFLAANDNGDRLGEVALVDSESRIGALGTVFSNTLLDENAASHLALGSGYLDTVAAEDRDRVNRSRIHVDFMIGSAEVNATGVTREGEEVPILRSGRWQV